ncbi:hypothetical protein TGAM01_v210504 [Trichoderma gamsii]|uniref:Uncharacterized protein n=1 Tax=Trichoderma gamsii TaxID=398673 RepID=A0A2P4Z8L9_9HYPO|nr:hypothetical protein TGAM01_v210504 [Trichoderma gamsii]PON20630.1 hypothetical protein TGAM01_v210504 [Trichoderma gamsii]
MVSYTICRKPPQARYLAHRYAQKALLRNEATELASKPEKLYPGQERLYSFYEPSMVAGLHRISTEQVIRRDENKEKEIKLNDSQDFNVVAPKFKLPDRSVHSVYPPQGHTDNVEILPHIVLTNPQLPWTRRAVEIKDPKARNRVPWLALLVFSQHELAYPKLSKKQTSTLDVNLSLGELGSLVAASDSDCISPAVQANGDPHDGDSKDIGANFVFVPKDLFNALFKNYEQSTNQNLCDVTRYQWFSHTRNINTTGMANSGIDGEEGVFSVVISQRSGPLDIKEPTDLIIHLVSIENVADMPYPVQKDRVALCSLESWSYTCLPPDSFNVYDAFRHVGSQHDVLRVDPEQIKKSLPLGQQLPSRLERRLLDGYVITRYRTKTGEQTAAWIRGPFVPTFVNHGKEDTPMSYTGEDLQIMDKELGIMDITYSTAWQVGKSLALADQGYTTALSRLRLTIGREGMEETKKEILKANGFFQNRNEILHQLAESLKTLRSLRDPARLQHGPDARWMPLSSVSVDMSRKSSLVKQHYSEFVAKAAERVSRSTTEGVMYNELNTPLNPDWMIVFSWILDRIYLAGVPAHYYIPDPSYLPPESLRFFHIDRHWVDSLIDGALSIGSHQANDEKIRKELKKRVNDYLGQAHEGLHYQPQRPGFGFLLRSELCIKFPDLIVEAYRKDQKKPDPTIIIRQENIAEGVLLVMFETRPGSADLSKIIFREPPHQQAFACGASLKPTHLSVAYRKIYTIPLSEQEKREVRTYPIKTLMHYPGGGDKEQPNSKPIFTWNEDGVDVRALRLPEFADRVHSILKEGLKDDYTETDPTATMMGIQLNNPMWYLEVRITPNLFPPSEWDSNDDGLLAGLRMLRDPVTPLFEAALCESSNSKVTLHPSGIDWKAAFATPAAMASQAAIEAIIPTRLNHLSPHIRPLTVQSKSAIFRATALQAAHKLLGASMESSLDRLLMGFSMYSLAKPSAPGYLDKLSYRQDLVFSLRKKDNSNDGWIMKRITVTFPYGTPDSKVRATLMDFYDGPGATMVTDYRLNVVTSLTADENGRQFFHLAVVPRAETIVMRSIQNLSFTLSGIMIADYSDWPSGKTPSVKVTVKEEYEHRNPQDGSTNLKLNL